MYGRAPTRAAGARTLVLLMGDRQSRHPPPSVENRHECHIASLPWLADGARVHRRAPARRLCIDATGPNNQSAGRAAGDRRRQRGEAARYAPGELSEAHTKLALADTAVTERKMMVAEHFADQSRAEAELASAKTSAAKDNAVNDEMQRSNGTLVDEMKRGAGDKQ